MSDEDRAGDAEVHEEQARGNDAWRDDMRQSQPGGMAASGEQSEGGGEGYESGRTHTGWGPADGELAEEESASSGGRHHGDGDAWRDHDRRSQPGGMAASSGQSQGDGGGYESGRTHTGWGPADGELADEETTRKAGSHDEVH
ncbi:hypothetical protein V3G39_10095 [Dermatophilaceae bacterium Sec6.4]